MKISVIIPTYKPQDYIWECLGSIKNQTFPKDNFEVILVLNGCKEPYYSQIQEYIDKNFVGYNVNFIHTDIGGVSNARNIALDVAKGEYVTFVDDDDYISPKFLEALHEKVAPNVVALGYAYAFNDGKPEIQIPYSLTSVYEQYSYKKNVKLQSKVRKYFSGPCMKLIPKCFIQDRRFNTRFKNSEDSLFMFLISDNINKLAFATKDATYYRRYRENSAVTRKRSKRERIMNSWNCIVEYVKIYCNGKYSTYFFMSRIAASVRSVVCALVDK